MSKTPIVVYGAGGHAREIAWLIDAVMPEALFTGYIDDAADRLARIDDRQVWALDQYVTQHGGTRIVIGVGHPVIRRALTEKAIRNTLTPTSIVHPSARRSPTVEIGVGCVVFPGTTLTVNVRVDDHVHINVGCTVSHDTTIGQYSTLAPGVTVCGNVHIGSDAIIGAGATIINGTPRRPLVIGDGSLIGAGACVTSSTSPHTVYAGVPARPVRERETG